MSWMSTKIWYTLCVVLISSTIVLAGREYEHVRLHNDMDARQAALDTPTSIDLQAYSTIYTYSFWSYSPITASETTSFSSTQVTTSTVITVYARDQFHALQSLLTAGQSVQDSANSSAAKATAMPTAPASTEATATSIASRNVSSSVSAAASGGSEPAETTSTMTREGVGSFSTAPDLAWSLAALLALVHW